MTSGKVSREAKRLGDVLQCQAINIELLVIEDLVRYDYPPSPGGC